MVNTHQQNIISQTADFIRKELCKDSSGHDWHHIERVWKLSQYIAEHENADHFIVALSALLHDLEDYKLADTHASLIKTRNWLHSQQVEADTIEKICHIIHGISFKGALVSEVDMPLEGKIVQDADRLDAIGAIGIARAFAYGGFKSRSMYDPAIKPVQHQSFDDYKNNNGTTINHFYEKLLLLKDRMHTRTAKHLAEQKHQVMVNFLENFYQEWSVYGRK